MENMKLKIELLPGAEQPKYIKDSVGFDLKVLSFKRVFKGREELDLKYNLKQSLKIGKLLLRPFERMVVGTGVLITLPQGVILNIVSKPSLVISQGLTVLSSPIDSNYQGEVDIILYNGSQFLSEVCYGDIVAKGILSLAVKGEFELE